MLRFAGGRTILEVPARAASGSLAITVYDRAGRLRLGFLSAGAPAASAGGSEGRHRDLTPSLERLAPDVYFLKVGGSPLSGVFVKY